MSQLFSKKRAYLFIILLGLVSLFADITYEGARSITGPYLSLLGATGLAVGIAVGAGEWIGYSFRAISGYAVDKTQAYWTLTIAGYLLNLLALPLLAFASTWQMAVGLIILERLGKSIRVPARDAMLSFATKEMGRGKGFGLHEAIDQIGAVIGPLLISALLFFKGSYRIAFLSLFIPALFSLLFLLISNLSFTKPRAFEPQSVSLKTKGFHKNFWIYLLAVGLVGLGYVDFAIIAYHFNKASILSSSWIPLFYAIAMGVGGLSALLMGRIFDLKGLPFLALITALSSLFVPLVFFGHFWAALLGMILWGIGMSSQESIMRAFVAEMVPPDIRGSAYGLLNFSFGLFWAIGSALIGLFYDISLIALVCFSIAAQLAAVPLFLIIKGPKKL